LRKDASPSDSLGSGRRERSATGRALGSARSLLSFPDDFGVWSIPAVVTGAQAVRRFRPDVIVSSSPHPSAHVVGGLVSRWTRVPWVADYRDLWSGNPYAKHGRVRRGVERHLERALLDSARSITTVTAPLARSLRERFGSPTRPVHDISNGFDPDEWRDIPWSADPDGRFVLLYAGVLYGGTRDLTPVLHSLARLVKAGVIDASTVSVDLYGDDPGALASTAARLGIGSVLRPLGRVDRSEVLRRMREAAVLLLPLDPDPSLRPAKVFEYVAAGRPILALGEADGAAAQVVRAVHAGVVTADAAVIDRTIRDWYESWRRTGELPLADAREVAAYTHERMAELFDSVLGQAAGD
jgi:glycosyltransferase involved in cell wall biosynthesis